jgi:hypothetical protein
MAAPRRESIRGTIEATEDLTPDLLRLAAALVTFAAAIALGLVH